MRLLEVVMSAEDEATGSDDEPAEDETTGTSDEPAEIRLLEGDRGYTE